MPLPIVCAIKNAIKKKGTGYLFVVEDENSAEKLSTRDKENYENLD